MAYPFIPPPPSQKGSFPPHFVHISTLFGVVVGGGGGGVGGGKVWSCLVFILFNTFDLHCSYFKAIYTVVLFLLFKSLPPSHNRLFEQFFISNFVGKIAPAPTTSLNCPATVMHLSSPMGHVLLSA